MGVYRIYHGDHFAKYTDATSCCCIPEINITLYVNYTSAKIYYYWDFRESYIFLIQIVKEPCNGL